jgi:hypothetical protein
MKANRLLLGAFAAVLATPAHALTFEITGATAFRQGTILAVSGLYSASGQPWRFCHNRSTTGDYINADYITFEGTITGLPGTTVIRCAFNGSIEGLRAIAQTPTHDASYYKLSALTIAATTTGANQAATPTSGNLEAAEAEMAFSDTAKSISPYASYPMAGGAVGVVVFGLVTNEGSAITNVTTQQYNSLLSNGYVPLSFFTGVSTDTSLVFCTGRNDGSGTRSSYLSEMGYGVANSVQQYLVVGSEGNQITAIQNVPAGGINGITPGAGGSAGDIDAFDAQPGTAGFQDVTQLATSASTVWGNDVPGNGGAFSGSVLRGHLALRGDSVTVFDADGYDLLGGAQSNIGLVSWVSLNDAIVARGNGAQLCAFNGVSLAVNGGTGANEMTTADKNKVYYGNYTAWNFQNLYRRTTASTETINLYNLLVGSIPNFLGTAGLKSTDMKVGRTADGGTINPIF